MNTTEDEQSKMATDFSPNDIAFFKKAVNCLFKTFIGNLLAGLQNPLALDYQTKKLKNTKFNPTVRSVFLFVSFLNPKFC